MERDELQNALDENKSVIVRHCPLILMTIVVVLISGLSALKIDEKPILRMVFDYFIR